MNELEHVVTEIIDGPKYQMGFWHVDVIADCWGSEQKTTLTFKKEESAEKVVVGYRFKG